MNVTLSDDFVRALAARLTDRVPGAFDKDSLAWLKGALEAAGDATKPAMNKTTRVVSERMQILAEGVGEMVELTADGANVAWCLVIFTDGRASYVSNAKRDEVAIELRALLDYWDAGLPDVPAHEVT